MEASRENARRAADMALVPVADGCYECRSERAVLRTLGKDSARLRLVGCGPIQRGSGQDAPPVSACAHVDRVHHDHVPRVRSDAG